MTMTNCPGRAALAISGWRISSRNVASEKSSRATISNTAGVPGFTLLAMLEGCGLDLLDIHQSLLAQLG